MIATCAPLLGLFVADADMRNFDRSQIFRVPVSAVARLTPQQLADAKECAVIYGVRYRIVQDR